MSNANSKIYLIVDQAVLCRADDIRQIAAILQREISNELAISAVLSDGTEKTFAGAQELVEFKNPKTRRISEINIGARVTNPDYRSMTVTISRRYSSDAASVKVHGETDDKSLVVIRQELGEIIGALKSPFAWVSSSKIALSLFVAAVWVGVAVYIANEIVRGPIGQLTPWINVGLLCAVALSALAVIWLTYVTIRRLFPICTFLVGDEIAENERTNSMRTTLSVGVLLSFLVGLAAIYVAGHLF